MKVTKLWFVGVVACLLLAGRADNVEAQRLAGNVTVKDANGVVLGRVVSLTMSTDAVASQVVVLTPTGFVVAIGVDGTPVAAGAIAFATKDCTGQAYVTDSSSGHMTASLGTWAVSHHLTGKYLSATGASAPATMASMFPSKGGGACMPSGTSATPNWYPVRVLTPVEVGLPASIKAPLTIQ